LTSWIPAIRKCIYQSSNGSHLEWSAGQDTILKGVHIIKFGSVVFREDLNVKVYDERLAINFFPLSLRNFYFITQRVDRDR
jgi:hypothetical protein